MADQLISSKVPSQLLDGEPSQGDWERYRTRMRSHRLCSDWHLNKMCRRGDLCQYDHEPIDELVKQCFKSTLRMRHCMRDPHCKDLTCLYGHAAERGHGDAITKLSAGTARRARPSRKHDGISEMTGTSVGEVHDSDFRITSSSPTPEISPAGATSLCQELRSWARQQSYSNSRSHWRNSQANVKPARGLATAPSRKVHFAPLSYFEWPSENDQQSVPLPGPHKKLRLTHPQPVIAHDSQRSGMHRSWFKTTPSDDQHAVPASSTLHPNKGIDSSVTEMQKKIIYRFGSSPRSPPAPPTTSHVEWQSTSAVPLNHASARCGRPGHVFGNVDQANSTAPAMDLLGDIDADVQIAIAPLLPFRPDIALGEGDL